MEYNYRYPYFAILVIGILFGLYRYSKLMPATRVLVFLLVLTLVTEGFSYYLALKKFPNGLVYNLFMLAQPILVGFAFLQESSKQAIQIVLGIVTLLTTVFWLQISPSAFNSNGLVIVLVFLAALPLNYFYQLLRKETEVPIHHFPLFWVSVGFLIFGVLNIFNFGMINSLNSNNAAIAKLFANISIYSNYFLYLLFIIAFSVPQNSLRTQ